MGASVEATPFLTKDFVQLCVFDGERQGAILDHNSTVAKETISTLCQFNILDEARNDIKQYVDRIAAEQGKGDAGQHTRLMNKKNEAENAPLMF